MQNGKKITVVHVLECLCVGGREKIVTDLVNGLAQQSFDVHLVLLSNDNNALLSSLDKSIQVYCLPVAYKNLGGISAITFWSRAIFLLRKIFKKVNPHIVHTHLLFQQLLLASVSIKLAVPKAKHFQTVHTAGLYFSEKGFMNSIRLATEKYAISLNKSFIVAIADPVYELCMKHFSDKASEIRCIYNGVDTSKFDYRLREQVSKEEFGFTGDDIIVTYVARMDEGKNHITLLKAWEKVSIETGAKLLLVGDGPLKRSLQQFTTDHKLDSSVIFFNTINFVERILAITDVGAFPSLFEGFSIAILEKMSMKVPLVVSDISSMRNFLQGKTSCLFFTPANHNELAENLMLLIRNKQCRYQIAEQAYKTAQPFTLQATISNHILYYTDAIGN